jgi:hypothetical protein
VSAFGDKHQQTSAQVNTPYPTAILVREKAMVINLESIRMIICKDQVRGWEYNSVD